MTSSYVRDFVGTYQERRLAYLDYCTQDRRGGRDGFVGQLAWTGRAWETGPFREAIEQVDARMDCADFAVAGLLRFLYLHGHRRDLPDGLVAEIERCVLHFRYWWDEPGHDSMCFHTENHQILFHSNELLAGQLFGDRVFDNSGMVGERKIEHAEPLIWRWLDLRAAVGWSEWLANGYTEHNVLALLNLYDFATLPQIRARARLLMDVLMYELSLHTYRGVFGSTHGRSYAGTITDSLSEGTASLCRLAFGAGAYRDPASLGAVAMVTSDYQPPAAVRAIAADLGHPATFDERQSFDVGEAERFGIGFDRLEDGHVYWAMQEFMHPRVLRLTERLTATFDLGLDRDWRTYAAEYRDQRERHGRITDPLRDCHALTEARIRTYRSDSGMLSSVQDYRPGSPGYQHHVWQATLGPDAVVFTNHPGSDDVTSRPNFWAGNGILPRAAQIENVLACAYRIPPDDPFPFSHAYFPYERFDEVVERGRWLFARLGTGYLALRSQHPWQRVGAAELRVSTSDNIWLCELGRVGQRKDFADFVATAAESPVRFADGVVRYWSPSIAGEVVFGWDRPMTLDGRPAAVNSAYRFDNPYSCAEIGARELHVAAAGSTLDLDFGNNTEASA
jgi:hypothetical protein